MYIDDEEFKDMRFCLEEILKQLQKLKGDLKK